MKAGKKTKAWTSTRARLKKIFEQQGITFCEICGTDSFLSFAHRFKRRHIVDQTELETVCLLCVPCHTKVESLPEYEMCRTLTKIIERREMLAASF